MSRSSAFPSDSSVAPDLSVRPVNFGHDVFSAANADMGNSPRHRTTDKRKATARVKDFLIVKVLSFE